MSQWHARLVSVLFHGQLRAKRGLRVHQHLPCPQNAVRQLRERSLCWVRHFAAHMSADTAATPAAKAAATASNSKARQNLHLDGVSHRSQQGNGRGTPNRNSGRSLWQGSVTCTVAMSGATYRRVAHHAARLYLDPRGRCAPVRTAGHAAGCAALVGSHTGCVPEPLQLFTCLLIRDCLDSRGRSRCMAHMPPGGQWSP